MLIVIGVALILLALIILFSFISWFLIFAASLFVTEDVKVSWQEFNPKSLIRYISNERRAK